MPDLNRKRTLCDKRHVSLESFDGKPLLDFLQSLLLSVEEFEKQYPKVELILSDQCNGRFGILAYGLESDEQYNTRIQAEYAKEVKDRERDYATLKRLQAKYPDVKIEL
jgi:hypothetical protein